ncbi:glycosyltransferase family 2 protein [Salinibacterium sp.]|uniref:glycosyltransferase family 2 protein n=1 Tax=Salinibacterium sp. TaxID=1915057 RepID=UPI00286BA3B7|nr:glycosyltransferase family 2 protein [Salinibacterium sp.]
MSRTWVVIPMFNETTAIGAVVSGLLPFFPNVVCVDDGSSDDSISVARAAGAHVIPHPINLGQGASLKTGLEFALADAEMTEIVSFDADGQHLVEDAVGMVAKLRTQGLDVVFGSRFLDGRTDMGRVKRLVLRMAAGFMRLTSGLPLTDAHNGLRVMNRSLALRLDIKQNRMAHASELVDRIGRLDVRWAEYPTHIVYTEYSKAKGQSLFNSVNILVELLFK